MVLIKTLVFVTLYNWVLTKQNTMQHVYKVPYSILSYSLILLMFDVSESVLCRFSSI